MTIMMKAKEIHTNKSYGLTQGGGGDPFEVKLNMD